MHWGDKKCIYNFDGKPEVKIAFWRRAHGWGDMLWTLNVVLGFELGANGSEQSRVLWQR